MSQKNVEKGQGYYNEALRHDDTHEKSILALAKLYPLFILSFVSMILAHPSPLSILFWF